MQHLHTTSISKIQNCSWHCYIACIPMNADTGKVYLYLNLSRTNQTGQTYQTDHLSSITTHQNKNHHRSDRHWPNDVARTALSVAAVADWPRMWPADLKNAHVATHLRLRSWWVVLESPHHQSWDSLIKSLTTNDLTVAGDNGCQRGLVSNDD